LAVNRNKPDKWKADIVRSVDLYNSWFLEFAPEAFRNTRIDTTEQVKVALSSTSNLTDIRPAILVKHPEVLPMLRMSTCPPIARDRLIGLSGVSPNLIKSMEMGNIPARMSEQSRNRQLRKIAETILKLADIDIFVWLRRSEPPTAQELHRAATVVADRLCGSMANPIIRNAQERRQLASIAEWLIARGYVEVRCRDTASFEEVEPGTFCFRLNVQVKLEDGLQEVNIPVDAVIMPKSAKPGELPLLIEAKSAGDFTNVNKRRKEEAVKMAQLRGTYGEQVRFVLFLCGYFDSGYLGYEAAEGIDWIWEHRIEDMALLGL
jgi:hypothetical protein